MYKKYQLYCVGQKPLVYSVTKSKRGVQWHKDGVSNVKYGLSKLVIPNSKRKLYQLSFTYQFEYS